MSFHAIVAREELYCLPQVCPGEVPEIPWGIRPYNGQPNLCLAVLWGLFPSLLPEIQTPAVNQNPDFTAI